MIARTAREETLHDRVASQFPVRTVARSPLAADAGFDADEQKLVEGCRRGDPEAFRSLVVHNGGRMLAAARRMLASDEDARDVVQDAFLYAFRAIDGFQATSRVSTWLHRILVNAALMKLRTRRRRPEQSIDDLLPHFDDAGSFPVAPEAAETADVLLERREIRVAVRRAIDA